MAKRISELSKKHLLILIFIVFIAGFLRFWQLGSTPISLTWDEVAWVYNAYSLGIDGRDEFGVFLPTFYLESFGDFKPPLYAYLSIIPVKIFGMTAFAARFASAFFGTLTVLSLFFLIRHIFYSSERKELYALSGALLLALSPWHIMLSRGAWEANIVTFLLVLGVWLFLKGINGQKWYIPLSAFILALAPYTFNSGRVVLPLILLMLGIGFYKKLLSFWKVTLVALLIGGIMLVPYIPHLLSHEASLRFREVTYFSDISVAERFNTHVINDDNTFWSRVLHHRYLIYTVMFLEHYLDHLDPVYLFVTGDDNPKFSTQDVGQLYLWSLPFLVIGTLSLFRRREGHWWIIPLWILIGIVPAATAWDTPHALRTGTAAPLFDALIGYGFISSLFWLRALPLRPLVQKGVISIAVVTLFINVTVFLHGYFVHYNREHASLWQDSYKEIFTFTESEKAKYDELRLSTTLGRPYIYLAFYTHMEPSVMREQIALYRETFGFVKVTKLGEYHFADVQDHAIANDKKVLFVSEPEQIPPKAKILKEFYSQDGTLTMKAYEIDE